jgi:hypothetical protein
MLAKKLRLTPMITVKRSALRRALPVAIVATSLSFLTFACGESKVAQCNKFTTAANKAKDFANSSEALKGETDPTKVADKIGQLADQLDGLNNDIKAISLSDDKLKAFQTQYTELVGVGAKDMRSLAGAIKNKNREEATRSAQSLQEVGPKLINVDQDLNKYCSST